MKMEKMDKEEDKGKKKIFLDNEKSRVLVHNVTAAWIPEYNAILWNFFKDLLPLAFGNSSCLPCTLSLNIKVWFS